MADKIAKLEIIKNPSVDIVDLYAQDFRIIGKDRALVLGQDTRFEPNAFRALVRTTAFDNGAVEALDNAVTDGAGYEAVNAILKKMRDVKFTLAFDGKNVTRFNQSSEMHGAMTGDVFYNVMERLISHRSDLGFHSVHVDSDGLGAVVQLKTLQEITHPLMRSEAIHQGLSIDFNRFDGVSFQSFFERLVCTNGLIAKDFKEKRALNLMEDPSVWYDQLFNEATSKQIVERYWNVIAAAGGTQLSIRELEMVDSYLFNNFTKDVDKMSNTALGNSHWKAAYTKNGWDVEQLTTEQKAMAPTPINKWEAINVLTDIVSHASKSNVPDRTRNDGMKLAGDLLYKHSDSSKWMLNLPSFEPNQFGFQN